MQYKHKVVFEFCEKKVIWYVTSTLISSFRIIFQDLSFISKYRATSCKIEQELKVNKKLSLFLIFSLLAFSLKNIFIFPQVQYKILDREKFFPSDRAAGNREGKYSTLRYNMINCAENLLSRHQSTTDFGFVQTFNATPTD